jgi:hypothetical protein
MKYFSLGIIILVLQSCSNEPKKVHQHENTVSNKSHSHDCQHHTFQILKDVVEINRKGNIYIVNDKYIIDSNTIPESLNKFYGDSNSKDSVEFFITEKFIDGQYRDIFNQLDEFLKQFKNGSLLQINTKGDRSCYKGQVKLDTVTKAYDNQGKEYNVLILPSYYHTSNNCVIDTTEYYVLDGKNLNNLKSQFTACNDASGTFSLGLDTNFLSVELKLSDKITKITAFKKIRTTCDL